MKKLLTGAIGSTSVIEDHLTRILDREFIDKCKEIANLPVETGSPYLAGQLAALDLMRDRFGIGSSLTPEARAKSLIDLSRTIRALGKAKRKKSHAKRQS